jgi:hypothetical protein
VSLQIATPASSPTFFAKMPARTPAWQARGPLHKGSYLRGGAKYGGGSGTAAPSLRGSDAPQFRPVAES